MSERRPRVLVVLAHFDETRSLAGRPNYFPQGVGHAHLAGAFNANRVDVRIYSEVHSGPLTDLALLGWPDMLVLTGVTSAFDRMRHLTAYVRVLAPHAVVVAGGPAVRCLPTLSSAVFDYSCHGDVEELAEIAGEVFGLGAAAEQVTPRFDLLGWGGPVAYVESSRYCNFRCSFCALTGEGRHYRSYDLGEVQRQIEAQGRGRYVLFIDNTFYGPDRRAFEAKIAMLRTLWRAGVFRGWVALVTGDFFAHPANLALVRDAGCVGLFSGVESFDEDTLRRWRKRQNTAVPQLAAIEQTLNAGLVFQYGVIFDPAAQTIAEMNRQIDFLIDHHRIPLPSFFSLTIPLLGTPFFHETVAAGGFLPNVKLRDMDGCTLVTRPLDPLQDAAHFVRRMKHMRWASVRALRRGAAFHWRYRSALSPAQHVNLAAGAARLCYPSFNVANLATLPRFSSPRESARTYVSTTQPLGVLFEPMIKMPLALKGHFTPTMITDESGALHPAVADDLSIVRAPGRKTV